MATPYRIRVSANDTGLLKWKQNDEAAAKVSELLQADLESHHVFFNARGFHNHIVHHLLALYGTGATPEALQEAYAENVSYQVKAMEPRASILEELRRGWTKDSPYLGDRQCYSEFLRFFQDEIEKKGWQEVLQEYVFTDDERSLDMFGRLFAGILHPMIQLMYAIEWQQPALLAQALAQTAVHKHRIGSFFTKVEEAARFKSTSPRLTIPELFKTIRENNEKLVASPHWDDEHMIYDGVFARATDEALEFLTQVKVEEDELEEKLAEMVHSCAYVAAAAAFHPPYIPKFDFFLIHHLNSAPFFLTLFKFPWLSLSAKARILEWKIRIDIVQYIACGCPSLNLQAIQSFIPKNSSNRALSKPEELLPRFHNIVDDGHLIKVVRALLIAQELSHNCSNKPWLRITDDEMWLKVHYMLLEGAEGQKSVWVRSAGFDEAWKDIPKAE